MRKSIRIVIPLLALTLFCLIPIAAAGTTYQYTAKDKDHAGGDVTPTEALKMAQADAHTFIVDVRTRPEYVLVGHPTMAHHVPISFWTGKHTTKKYGMTTNASFAQDLTSRFDPKTDTLIFMCRSGGRSCAAADAAAKAGWPTGKIYNMLGGFEGDKIKNADSAFNGKRTMGGWKNEGLPWTYKVDDKLAYPESK
ncbi:MAG: rhodanese-like domain-containing protein [Desulfobacteraceae bacterium]|jgi:rhodanese-related sulfurtransferase